MSNKLIVFLPFLIIFLIGCTGKKPAGQENFLVSKNIGADSVIRKSSFSKNSGGSNRSPHLAWQYKTASGESAVLLMTDETPMADRFVHWLVINIPPDAHILKEGASGRMMPEGAIELGNSFGYTGYGGPAPMHGTGAHQYQIKLFLTDTVFFPEIFASLQPEARLIETVLKGHILEELTLQGTASLP